MQENLLQKINKALIYIFVSCWFIFLFTDYFVHEKFFSIAFKNVTFSAVIPSMLFFFGLFVWLHISKTKKFSLQSIDLQNLSGWKFFLLFFISTIAYVVSYGSFINAFEQVDNASVANYIILISGLLFFLLLLILPSFVAGSFVLDIFSTQIENTKSRLIIALGLGFVVIGTLLFALSGLHLLSFSSVALLFIIIAAIGYKRFIAINKYLWLEKHSLSEVNLLGLLSFFAIFVFIIINFNSSLRPIPIGFDELSLYMNTPKLIAGYNGLTHGGQAYNWSIWMSLGFILNNTVALATLISILPGILSCYVVYRIARHFADANYAALAAAIFYTMPTSIWQSSADAKVDLALGFFVLVAVLLLLAFNKGKETTYLTHNFYKHPLIQKLQANIWFNMSLVLGLLLGYAFGIKYTAIFFIIAAAAGLIYQYSESISIAAAVSFVGIAIIFLGKLYSFSGIEFDQDSQVKLIGAIFLLLAGVFMLIHFYKHKFKYLKGFLFYILFVIGLGLSFSPWLIKHYHENKSLNVNQLLNGKPAIESRDSILTYSIPLSQYHYDPTDERVLLSDNTAGTSDSRADSLVQYYEKAARNTSKYEEVLRYIGYEPGVPKFLSVFHDLGTLENVPNFPTDIGYFIFLFAPLLFINLRAKNIVSNLLNMLILLVILLVSFATLYQSRGIMDMALVKTSLTKLNTLNPDANTTLMSLYNTFVKTINAVVFAQKGFLSSLFKTDTLKSFIYLLGLILLVGIINYKTIMNWNKTGKLLLVIAGSALIMWWFFGSGITWYALPAIAVLIPLLLYSFYDKENGMLGDKVLYYIFIGFISIGLIIQILFRQESMVVTYSYSPKVPTNTKINQLFLQFSHGAHSSEECLETISRTIANSANYLNDGKNEKILRVGTSMNYFIENNDQRVYEDNQLDLFEKVYKKWAGTKDLISDNLLAHHIRYVLFDFATGNLDNTPDKSLTQKMKNFYDYISNNPRIEVVNTDRLVEDPTSKEMFNENGKQVPARFSIYGIRVLIPGTQLLIKIKD